MFNNLVSLTAFVLSGAAVLSAQHLSPTPEITSLVKDFSSKPVPKWEHGLFLSYEFDQTPAGVSAFDRTGREVTHALISIPGASKILLRAPAASPTGVLCIAGSAWTSDGVGASFIAWISQQGSIDKIIRTKPFAAAALAFGEDGTLWALGRVQSQDPKTETPHDVLRHYDREGKLIGSSLPRSSFLSASHQHPVIGAYLITSGDVIGIYSETSKEWVEVSSAGSILGRWPGLETSSELAITGVARLANGRVYVSAKRRSTGSELYYLEKLAGTWSRLDSTAVIGGTQRFGNIYGGENDELLISTRLPNFQWFRIE